MFPIGIYFTADQEMAAKMPFPIVGSGPQPSTWQLWPNKEINETKDVTSDE